MRENVLLKNIENEPTEQNVTEPNEIFQLDVELWNLQRNEHLLAQIDILNVVYKFIQTTLPLLPRGSLLLFFLSTFDILRLKIVRGKPVEIKIRISVSVLALRSANGVPGDFARVNRNFVT